MQKKIKTSIFLIIIFSFLLAACASENKSEATKEGGTEPQPSIQLSEEELQMGKGINGDLPEIDYSYEGIVDAIPGIYQFPSPYEKHFLENVEIWKGQVQEELKKIETPLSEEASQEEINDLFKKYLYIAGYDYPAVEGIDKFSYVIFQKDMENPFTNEKINENMNINVEIVLDASGSMGRKIGEKTMMEIAKESIEKVLSQLPAKAKVGLRIFGHLGDNSSSGKEVSCEANELVFPIETLNIEGIKTAIAPIQPTGWTSIAKSIEKGVEDLSSFQGEKDLNILYIITDGIETCGGDPIESAKKVKNEGANIVLGIVGFNVNPNQNAVLKKIAEAGGGHYASANDADKLTSELQRIHELAFSDYKWQTLDTALLNKIKVWQEGGVLHNTIDTKSIGELNNLNDLVRYGSKAGNGTDPKYANLYQSDGVVYKALNHLVKERKETIDKVLKEKYRTLKAESEAYLRYLESRKGEIVALVPSTSRRDPSSQYWKGYSNQGGTSKTE